MWDGTGCVCVVGGGVGGISKCVCGGLTQPSTQHLKEGVRRVGGKSGGRNGVPYADGRGQGEPEGVCPSVRDHQFLRCPLGGLVLGIMCQGAFWVGDRQDH